MVKYFNKKGLAQIYWMLMKMLVAIVALVVIVGIFFPGIIDQGDFLRGSLTEANRDSDGDGYMDFQDDCPCSYGDLDGEGCPLLYTEAEKSEDNANYNTDTGCGVLDLGDTEYSETTTALDSGGFQGYHSIELFGDTESVTEIGSAEIYQACVGYVGESCPSEDNDCDEKFETSEYEDLCWIMISEDDDWSPNDCGQVLVNEGTIISATTYSTITESVLENSFMSITDEKDPEYLTLWEWKSNAEEYGSLICKNNFWFGCQEGQEGKTLEVGDSTYSCISGEWVAQ